MAAPKNLPNVLVGTTPNSGDGDLLRDAFIKVNDNFNSLYTGGQVLGFESDSKILPGYAWQGDKDTGMYRQAAGVIGFSLNGTDSLIKTNSIQVNVAPPPPVTTGDLICSPGAVNLSASGSGNTIQWYTSSSGGTPINTGNTYSATINSTTTYFVSETIISPPQFGGPFDNTFYTGAYFTNNDSRGLLFDVLSECTLKSVKVFANVAGNRTIEVCQGVGGAVLFSKVVNIPFGESRITLDFNLPVGTQYHLKVTGALINLYRNSGGASYPYNISNLISITETDAAPGSPNYYYYFYDWEVVVVGCSSALVPVTVTVSSIPTTPTVSQNGTTLTSSSSVGNQWYLNGVLIPGATSQSYTATQNGLYTVKIFNNGCESTASTAVNVTTIITGISQTDNLYTFNVYPNPNEGNFTVSFNTNELTDYKLELRNTLGQIVYSEALADFSGYFSKQLNIAKYGKGIYLISLMNSRRSITYKVIKY